VKFFTLPRLGVPFATVPFLPRRAWLRALCLLAAGLGLGLLALVGYHARPIPLDPRIETWRKNERLVKAADQDNAYFALLGFNAPAGTEAHTLGSELAAAPKAQATPAISESIPVAGLLPVATLRLQGQLPAGLDNDAPPTLARLSELRRELDALIAANAELLARFQALFQYPHCYDGPRYVPARRAVPDCEALRVAHQLFLGRLALSLAEPAAGLDLKRKALAELAAANAFWRLVNVETNIPELAQLAAGCLERDYALLADFVARDAQLPALLGAVAAVLPAPLPHELDWRRFNSAEFLDLIDRVLAGDQSLETTLRRELGPLRAALLQLFYIKNQTANAIFDIQSPLGQTSSLQSYEWAKDLRAFLLGEWTAPGLHYLVNPYGKLLVRAILPAPDERGNQAYGKLYDLNLLLRAQLELLRARPAVKPEAAAAFIADLPVWFNDPFTRKPLAYDPATRTLRCGAHAIVLRL